MSSRLAIPGFDALNSPHADVEEFTMRQPSQQTQPRPGRAATRHRDDRAAQAQFVRRGADRSRQYDFRRGGYRR